MDYKSADITQAPGLRKSSTVKQKLALFTANPILSGPKPPQTPSRKSIEKPFASLYERTLSLIAKLYNIPDFEYYLFPDGIASLLAQDTPPVIDPISILWGCFRLGAPLCHLVNQLSPKNVLAVPDVSGIVTYTNVCKKCIYHFLIGVKDELGVGDADLFSISEVYKDDTNGLVKVIDVVDMVLEEIDSRGLSPPAKVFPFAMGQASVDPQDNRAKSIAELLATERKYIESMQELMTYKQELESKQIVSNDIIHAIFSNLPELLDFQRRFLFSLEATLALPPNEQHLGAIFIQYEDGFQVYNAMCASYSTAIKITLANQTQLAAGSIDPKSLQNYLIKPVQRICRYPLMLKEIIKLSSADTYPFYEELKEAEVVMKRVTDAVNEVQRMEENKGLKIKLMSTIEDLQGLNSNEWGDLLLSDNFPMTAQDTEQIYGIYLFEYLILCCKQHVKDGGKSSRKSKDVRTDVITNEIKGKIYASSISNVLNISDPDMGVFELRVFWNEGEESFILKCRNIEQVELWKNRITTSSSGRSSLVNGRRSVDNGRRSLDVGSRRGGSGFRRVVQSANSSTIHEAAEATIQEAIDKRTLSMPAMQRPITRTGTEINPRGSSIYMPKSRDSSLDYHRAREYDDAHQSMMSPSISKSMRNEIPNPVPRANLPRAPTPKVLRNNSTPNSGTRMPTEQVPVNAQRKSEASNLQGAASVETSRSLPPSTALPSPPATGLPRPAQSSGPPLLSAGAGGPPSSPLPRFPLNPISEPPRSGLPKTPLMASEVPPEYPEDNSPNAQPRSAVRQPRKTSQQVGRQTGSSLIKMKTHYGDLIFILAVPAYGAKFEDVLEKVERKIKICGATIPEGRRVMLKYKDEDGDMITLNTDEDIELVFDMARATAEKGSVVIQAE